MNNNPMEKMGMSKPKQEIDKEIEEEKIIIKEISAEEKGNFSSDIGDYVELVRNNFDKYLSEKETDINRHWQGVDRKAEAIFSQRFDVAFFEDNISAAYYPDNIIDILKQIEKNAIKNAILEEYTNHKSAVAYDNDSIRVYIETNWKQNAKKLMMGVVEFHFRPVRVLKSERFEEIEIGISSYVDKDIDFFQKLEKAQKAQILTDNVSIFHTLIKVDDRIISIQTFLESIGYETKGDILNDVEEVFKKFNIEFEYGRRN